MPDQPSTPAEFYEQYRYPSGAQLINATNVLGEEVYRALLGIQTIIADYSNADERQRSIVDEVCNGIRDGVCDSNDDLAIAVLQEVGQRVSMSSDKHFDYVGYLLDLSNKQGD